MKHRFLIVFLCLLILLTSVGGGAVSAVEDTSAVEEAQAFLDGILSFQQVDSVREWIDGALTEQAGMGTEWYVLALSQRGNYDFSNYEAALLRYLSEQSVTSAASRQKYALCLSSIGSTDGYISAVLEDSIGAQGIMSLVYGLHLLNNGYVSETYPSERVIRELLALQHADGGWSLTGQTGDVDVSAMTVQALAPHYDTERTVREAVDRALAFLSDRQRESGDYASYGVANPESTVQVLVALSSLGIDCATDGDFIKNGNTLLDGIGRYRLSDGSFCHKEGGESSGNATVQVFYGMVSYLRMREGASPLYLLDHSDPDGVRSAPSVGKTETAAVSETAPSVLTETEALPAVSSWNGDYRPWVCLLLFAAGGLICTVLFFMKKRKLRHYLPVAVIVAVALILVYVIRIEAPGAYTEEPVDTKEPIIGTVTLTVRCDTVAGQTEHLPEDGVLLDTIEVSIAEGDTVYDALREAARAHGLLLDSNQTAGTVYVTGIGSLYEFDFGALSGWVYHVNGTAPTVGCDEYRLSPGDVIVWHYTRDLGKDVT